MKMNAIEQVFSIYDLRKIIMNYAYVPKKYSVWESDNKTVFDYLEIGNPHDTIYYSSYNQLGCVEYKIKLDENNVKYLSVIWSEEDEYNDFILNF